MNKISLSRIFAPALLMLSAASSAITIDLTNPQSREGAIDDVYASEYNYSSEGLNLSVTGWSYCGSAYCTGSIQQTTVGLWTGLGVENDGEPNHAIDNWGDDIDMLLLEFDQAVSLESISTAWSYNGSDMSLMAYTGGEVSGFIGDSLTGVNAWEDLLNDNWTDEVGSYYNVAPEGTEVNPEGVMSRYWLIGAYTPSLGEFLGGDPSASGPTCPASHPLSACSRCWTDAAQAASGGCDVNAGGNWSHQPDFFKLNQLEAEVSPVPLPASAWLFISGLVGLRFLRAKKKSA